MSVFMGPLSDPLWERGSGVLEYLSQTQVWLGLLVVAVYLLLYWIFRGAPLGQSVTLDDTWNNPADTPVATPSASRRDLYAALAVTGVILLGLGAIAAIRFSIPWSLPLFALGFGLLIGVMQRLEPYRDDSPTAGRIHECCRISLQAALLGGILIMGNFLAFRYGGQPLDFTSSQIHSISPLTREQLGKLEKPVVFTIFAGQSRDQSLAADQLTQLLTLYRNANPEQVRIDRVDRFSRPLEFQKLVETYPELPLVVGGGLLIELGEGAGKEHGVLSNTDLFAVPPDGREANDARGKREFEFSGETQITSALVRMLDQDKPRIAFLTGHGELSIEDTGMNKPGAGLLQSRLNILGMNGFTHNLLENDLPKDAACVIIAAPKEPFQDTEIRRLESYLANGGRGVFLLSGNEVGLQDLLKKHHITIRPQTAVRDPRYNFQSRPDLIVAPIPVKPDHPIVDSLARRGILAPSSAPLEIVDGGNPRIAVQAILRTSPLSKGSAIAGKDSPANPAANANTNTSNTDIPGPITIGVAVEESDPKNPKAENVHKLVVFSSPYIGENISLAYNPPNGDLLTNAVFWLRGKIELLDIAPKTQTQLLITNDPSILMRIMLVPTLLGFAVIIGLGLTVYASRRSAS